jgi:predicted DNA binding CopG/RHH family protein
MKKKYKKVPKFKSEDEERSFWTKNDTGNYYDLSKAVSVSLPNLKPTTETISLRLPKGLLEDIKLLANKEDVPYQSKLKTLLSEKVREVKKVA